MSVTIVIPARLGSTRLSEKVLVDIHGKPMIQHVYERVISLREIDNVLIATDSQKVADVARSFGAQTRITPTELSSGSERVAFIAKEDQDKKTNTDIYVNVQGDEPLLDPQAVSKTIDLIKLGQFKMTTPAAPLQSESDLKNMNIVKVLVAENNSAVYFSRFPIPFSRLEPKNGLQCSNVFHHLGVYAYTCDTLLRYANLPKTKWEQAESLEQLRALYYGIQIGVAQTKQASIGVDTFDDLEKVRNSLRNF